jgi:flagellar FliL protein
VADKTEEISDVPEFTKKGPGGLTIIVILNLVAVIGLGAFLLLRDSPSKGHSEGGETVKASTTTADPKKDKEYGQIMSLSNFLVNLDDHETNRFVRLGVALELADPDKKAPDKMKEKEPLIRDTVITVVGNMNYQEFRSAQGKQTFREKLLSKLSEVLGPNQIRSVYFTEFIIQ